MKPIAAVPPFFDLPAGPRQALRHVRVPSSLARASGDAPLPAATSFEDGALAEADLLIEDGRIAAVVPAGTLDAALGPDLQQSMVLPGLADCHTHLDKGHIWPRQPNPDGTVPAASIATGTDRLARWHAEDVRRRMDFGLRAAFARGVVAVRTHLDSLAPQAAISFAVFEELRERWAGRVTLQASSILPIDVFLTDEGRQLADIVAKAGGQLGCVTRFRHRSNKPLDPAFDDAMRNLFALAAERGLDVDLHVDEASDPDERTLIRVARIAKEVRFTGRILCGHCCSLALQPDDAIDETLDACAEAGIAIVSLPTVNMYLQARSEPADRRTPRWRGVTLVHEMRARGMRVAVAGDNCRDPFHAWGDHDMLDTFTQAVKILHLDHPLGDWIQVASSMPADIMGVPCGRIAAGTAADLIVVRARNYSELLARQQYDRVVLRAGQAIDTAPPDYRELDDLMAA
jgi:cytosine deaminase